MTLNKRPSVIIFLGIVTCLFGFANHVGAQVFSGGFNKVEEEKKEKLVAGDAVAFGHFTPLDYERAHYPLKDPFNIYSSYESFIIGGTGIDGLRKLAVFLFENGKAHTTILYHGMPDRRGQSFNLDKSSRWFDHKNRHTGSGGVLTVNATYSIQGTRLQINCEQLGEMMFTATEYMVFKSDKGTIDLSEGEWYIEQFNTRPPKVFSEPFVPSAKPDITIRIID